MSRGRRRTAGGPPAEAEEHRRAAGGALFIVHYHFRPGGVRRVIELAASRFARELGATRIVLITGERPPPAWLRAFRKHGGAIAVRVSVDPRLGYAEERVGRADVRAALERAIVGRGVVWAHNLALGRNLALSAEVAALCAARDLPLLAHHHDWWCDRRWTRWPVIRRCGFRTLAAVARAIFPPSARMAHIAINAADARILRRHFPNRAHCLPNPIEPPRLTKPRIVCRAPMWLMPCRVLRRKNIAEALLLTRWLRPEATLVVSAAVDEMDEMAYAATLAAAARKHGWPLRLGALAAGRRSSIAKLYAAAEAIVFTSIQEGFGLPQVEAAAARLPAIVRRVPQVAPDLAALGFRFPQGYDEVLVAPDLFDWPAEMRRQAQAFRAWCRHLPRSLSPLATAPALLMHPHQPRPAPFSRLTLAAQLEVLRHSAAESWSCCAPLNPFLRRWRERAALGQLATTAWPQRAATPLSPRSYARRLAAIADIPHRPPAGAVRGVAAQHDFIRARLGAAEMFPLLWSHR